MPHTHTYSTHQTHFPQFPQVAHWTTAASDASVLVCLENCHPHGMEPPSPVNAIVTNIAVTCETATVINCEIK